MTEQQNWQNNSGIGWDSHTQYQLVGTAKIAGIVAVLTIANVVLGAIGHFLKPKDLPAPKEGFNDPAVQFIGSTNLLSVIFSLIINGLLFYLLYRFSTLTKKAVQTDNSLQMAQGLNSLSTYFRLMGVLIFAAIALAFMAVLAMSFGGALK